MFETQKSLLFNLFFFFFRTLPNEALPLCVYILICIHCNDLKFMIIILEIFVANISTTYVHCNDLKFMILTIIILILEIFVGDIFTT